MRRAAPFLLVAAAAPAVQAAQCLAACTSDADCPDPSCGVCWAYVCDPCQTKSCSASSPCPSQCDCSFGACSLSKGPTPPVPPPPTPEPPPPAPAPPTPEPPPAPVPPPSSCAGVTDPDACNSAAGCQYCYGASKCVDAAAETCCGSTPGHGTTCAADPTNSTTCCGGFWAEDFAKCCTEGGSCSEGIRHTGCCAAGKVACSGQSLYPGCCDPDQICCGSTYESPWCCSKDHGLCCGTGCCDSRSEVCLQNGTCASKGGNPTGCGGQCTSDTDCVAGGTPCDRCVPGPTGDYNVCAKVVDLAAGNSTSQTVRLSNKYPGVGALYVTAHTSAAAATAVELSVAAAADAGGCASTGGSWLGTRGLQPFVLGGSATSYCAKSSNPALPCNVLMTNAAPPPAAAVDGSAYVYPYLAGADCAVDVTLRRADTAAGATPVDVDIQTGAISFLQKDLPPAPSMLTFRFAGGQEQQPNLKPYIVGVERATSGGCDAQLILGSERGFLPLIEYTGRQYTAPGGGMTRPTLAVYSSGGQCSVGVGARYVPTMQLSPTANPTSLPFPMDSSRPFTTMLAQQKNGGGWPTTGTYDTCVGFSVTSGSCCVYETSSGRGYIYPVNPGKTVNFPLPYAGDEVGWSARMDVWVPDGTGSDACDNSPAWTIGQPQAPCEGTLIFNHSANCY